MLWILVGTGAFGLLFLFEYQKCRSVQRDSTGKNPWFLAGTLVLLLACAALGRRSVRSQGIQLLAGVLVLITGLAFYAVVLSVVSEPKGYTRDSKKLPVCRSGIYGRMRHPGVWSFLMCGIGYGMIFPDVLIPALWFSFLNLVYTWFQDRCFFPVYLEGYEQYRKEVPYLFPRKPGAECDQG